MAYWRPGMSAGAGMARLPKFFRVGSRLVLEILPSVAATVIGGYLLSQLHFGRASEPSPAAQIAATAAEEPTVGQDRAAMREVLKVRREKPEQPAQVRPIATSAPASTAAPASVPPAPRTAPATTAAIPVGLDSISPREPVARPVSAPSRPAVTVAITSPAAARPDAEGEVYVPAPPPGLPSAPARDINAPTVIVPATASETPAAPPSTPPAQPAQHGAVGGVFSTLSGFVGHAANATGHTVNWVIDLPGKAISAGGRAIGVSPPPPPPPARPFS
jgi:cytoskeletal protein RodZ